MIEIDLIPNVGPDANSIVSIAQADPDVWTGIAAQANQLASNAGYDIQTGPLYNSPERTLASVADVQGWLAAQNVGGAAACPLDLPAPQGYAVWQGAVPRMLSAWAVQLLKGVSKVPFGTTWTEIYNGATCIARFDVHTWHYLPDGTLLTGLCWKGITIYKPLPAGAGRRGHGHHEHRHRDARSDARRLRPVASVWDQLAPGHRLRRRHHRDHRGVRRWRIKLAGKPRLP